MADRKDADIISAAKVGLERLKDGDPEAIEQWIQHVACRVEANQRRLDELIVMAELSGCVPMCDLLETGSCGHAVLDKFTLSEANSAIQSVRAMADDASQYVEPGCYVRLFVDGDLMMTDTLHERATCYPLIEAAHGDLLITGLGIGMVIVPLCKNDDVRSITVIEKSPDVVSLVWPQIRRACPKMDFRVIIADAFTWEPEDKTPVFDVAWHDIWPKISHKNPPEIAALKEHYAPMMKEGGVQLAWVENEVEQMMRDEEAASARLAEMKQEYMKRTGKTLEEVNAELMEHFGFCE